MNLLACYGGSFDPVHLGHLAIARGVRDALDADVALVPAADPPHKDATHVAAGLRARMLELAIAGEPGLRVDRRELDRKGPSYTIDTLRLVRAGEGPYRPIAWVVGGDSLLQLESWYRWRELFSHGHVLAVARPARRLTPPPSPRARRNLHDQLDSRRTPAQALAETRRRLRRAGPGAVATGIVDRGPRPGRHWRRLGDHAPAGGGRIHP